MPKARPVKAVKANGLKAAACSGLKNGRAHEDDDALTLFGAWLLSNCDLEQSVNEDSVQTGLSFDFEGHATFSKKC